MLPVEKLQNRELAVNSIKRIAAVKSIEAVIPGDGWPIFKNGHEALIELSEKIKHPVKTRQFPHKTHIFNNLYKRCFQEII